jgi:type I restriction enzyme R subunit
MQASYIEGGTLTSDQLAFVDRIIDALTEKGILEPARLYEQPFTDLSPTGIDGLFSPGRG